jgi:hypothetical protein
MRLAEWMKRERYTDAQFVEKINEILKRDGHEPYGWRAVRTWRIGLVVPRPPVVVAISELTHGEVRYADHVAENAPRRKRGEIKSNG